MDDDVARLIERFALEPLPVEGTLFANTYRATTTTQGGGPTGTAMIGLFANEPVSRSLFHRLAFDEVWHFYAGDPLRLVLLHPDGSDHEVVLSSDVVAGRQVQAIVPAGTWQAAELVNGGRWALFGCTMAPGFTGDCFEGGRVADLLALYPSRADDINRLALGTEHPVSMPEGFEC